MYRSFHQAEKILSTTFRDIAHEHSTEGHVFIKTHWNRYVHLIMRMPAISPEWKVLEIGASILSNVIREHFGASMTTAYHELEPEWKTRFDRAGITSHPVELLRDPLPVPDGTYDLILFDEVMEHFPVDPVFFLRQCIAKLKPDGQLIVSVPNFATSQKRLQLLRGENPQDPMDKTFVYYAHHREPVMSDCIDFITQSGGIIDTFEWSDFDTAPDFINTSWYMLRCIRHRMFHRIIHQLIPSTRSYLFLRVKKPQSFRNDPATRVPPLSLSDEFRRPTGFNDEIANI